MPFGKTKGSEKLAAHFVQVADVERVKFIQHTQLAQQVGLGIFRVEAVQLVQRGLDGERAVRVDLGRAAEAGLALEHEDAPALARADGCGGEAAEAGADDNGVVGGHGGRQGFPGDIHGPRSRRGTNAKQTSAGGSCRN